MKSDVVIVGAGPAGSAAAITLGQRGLRVILLDKAKFPRDKVCGDVVSPIARRCLDRLGLGAWIAEGGFTSPQVLALHFPTDHNVRIERSPALPDLGVVIPRVDLDQALVGRATDSGAELLEETEATAAIFGEDGVTVDCRRGVESFAVRAQLMLLADGSVSQLSRGLGLTAGRPNGIGLRTYIRSENLGDDTYRIFFLRRFLPGYCWIIPMGDGLFNVGIGLLMTNERDRRVRPLEGFRAFLSDPGTRRILGAFQLAGKVRGHSARVWTPGIGHITADRTLLLGDAAALIHPLSGEGIGPALQSGIAAATQALHAFEAGCFSDSFLSHYAVVIRRTFGRDYRAASRLRRLLARPWIAAGAAYLGEKEPEFTLLLARAVLAQESARLFHPSTLVRGGTLWPLRVAAGISARR